LVIVVVAVIAVASVMKMVVTTETQVQCQASPRGICGGQSVTETHFFFDVSFLPTVSFL